MIYQRPNSVIPVLQTKPIHGWNILPSAECKDPVKPNSCQTYICRGNCPCFVVSSAQSTCEFKFPLLIRLNVNQVENEPYSCTLMAHSVAGKMLAGILWALIDFVDREAALEPRWKYTAEAPMALFFITAAVCPFVLG